MIQLYSSNADYTYDYEEELSKIEFFNTIQHKHCLTHYVTCGKNDSGEWFHASCTEHRLQDLYCHLV